MSTMTEHSIELDAVGPAGSGGGRGPSALSPGRRWSVARKREVVLRLLRGEAAESLSRELAVPVYRLERWRERALAGIEGALREREGDPLRDELGAAMRRLGELTMENELLRARAERPGPLARRRSR
jgi:transposase-like protein